MVKWTVCVVLGTMLFARGGIAQESDGTIQPANGFVPDAITAVRIAEAILDALVGEPSMVVQRPYVASLEGDVWEVKGTWGDLKEKYIFGARLIVEISRSDGRILRVTAQ